MKRNLKDMNIGSILALSYIFVIVLFFIAMIFSVFAVHTNASTTQDFYNRPFTVSKSAISLRNTLSEISGDLSLIISEKDPEKDAENLASIKELSDQRTKEFEIVSSSFTANKELLTQFRVANDAVVVTREKILAAIHNDDMKLANELYQNEYLSQLETALLYADEIVDTAANVADSFLVDTKQLEITTYLALAGMAAIIVAVVLIMWRRITRAIAVPVEAIEKAAERFASGDLHASIDYSSGNELGGLASSINATIESLKRYISEMDRVLNLLGDGKLDAKANIVFEGDYAAIGLSLSRITASLRTTVVQLNEAVNQVMRSSSQMSDGSQSVAQGSAEQAMAIEELATNVQNIERVIGENAESVLVVNAGTTDVLSAVENGSEQIVRTAQVINQIRDNTKSISQLASTIEDIAFQTNILALNASVEAARAGESGRGFSIVADEIRRLAARASEASQEADELTSRTIASIEDGGTMIEAAASNMGGAVLATENVKEMMSNIAQASTQQIEALSQIRESMDRLSDVVQENSAAAEESAAIAEELADQAGDLMHLIDRFELDQPEDAKGGR